MVSEVDIGRSTFITKEGWRRAVFEEPAVPIPAPSQRDWASMDIATQEDVTATRMAYHSALGLVQTPQLALIHRRLHLTLAINARALGGARRGQVISGLPNTGKTTTVTSFGIEHERQLRARHPERFSLATVDYTPVVYITVEAKSTPKSLTGALAHFLNLPLRVHATQHDLNYKVVETLGVCGTELIIVDDIHFLDLAHRDGRVVNDHLKFLANTVDATFVFVGVDVEHTSFFGEGGVGRATQTAGRFGLLHLDHFCTELDPGKPVVATARQKAQVDDWIALLHTFEQALRLRDHVPGTLPNMWQYLLGRTHGVLASLSALVRFAAEAAIETGTERITRDVLDQIEVDIAAESAFHASRRRAGPPL